MSLGMVTSGLRPSALAWRVDRVGGSIAGFRILPIGRADMAEAHYAAGCLCGAVRLESSIEPRRVGVCHCLDCRKHHGAVFATFAIFPADAVTITGKTV